MRLRRRIPRTNRSSDSRRMRLIAAALVAAAFVPTADAAGSFPLRAKATAHCNAQLRKHDGTDVFTLSPNEVLALAKDIGDTEPLLRRGFPRSTYAQTRRLRLQLKHAAHLGRVYARAYRADPTDNSLPQEAAFENSLLDLRKVAKARGLPACSVRLAER